MSTDPYYASIPTFHSSCQNKPLPCTIVSIHLPSFWFEVSKSTIHLFHIFGIFGWVSRLDRSNANNPLSSSETCREWRENFHHVVVPGWAAFLRVVLSVFSRNSEWQVWGSDGFLLWEVEMEHVRFVNQCFRNNSWETSVDSFLHSDFPNFSEFLPFSWSARNNYFGYPDKIIARCFSKLTEPRKGKIAQWPFPALGLDTQLRAPGFFDHWMEAPGQLTTGLPQKTQWGGAKYEIIMIWLSWTNQSITQSVSQSIHLSINHQPSTINHQPSIIKIINHQSSKSSTINHQNLHHHHHHHHESPPRLVQLNFFRHLLPPQAPLYHAIFTGPPHHTELQYIGNAIMISITKTWSYQRDFDLWRSNATWIWVPHSGCNRHHQGWHELHF